MRNEIKQYLKKVALRRSDAYTQLKKGDKVKAGAFLDYNYEIDDPEIYRKLIGNEHSMNNNSLKSICEIVHKIFPNPNSRQLFQINSFEEKKVVPFSRAVELGIGE